MRALIKRGFAPNPGRWPVYWTEGRTTQGFAQVTHVFSRPRLVSAPARPGLALLLVFALGLAACGSSDEPAQPDAAASAAGDAPTPVETTTDQLPDVVARVNGQKIGREDFERAIRAAEAQAQQVVPAEMQEDVYLGILERLVAFHLLMQESETRDITIAEADVDAEVARIQSQFPSMEAFEQRLTEWQTTIDILREETRKDLLIAKVIESVVEPRISLDEPSVRAFYDEHQQQFVEPGAVQASHILIGVAPNADAATRAQALEQAERLVAETRNGADFAALAREHSTDAGTAANGGDLGFVTRGQTVPPFEEALYRLADGEVSDAVESPFGYHVIRAVERRGERIVSFEEAGGEIRFFLLQQERDIQTEAFLEELRDKSAIQIYL